MTANQKINVVHGGK